MDQIHQFRFPTDIRYGAGARKALGDFAERHGVRRPILVTDFGLPHTEAYRLGEQAAKRVWTVGFEIFSAVRPNPTDGEVERAFAAFRRGRCDAVVGLGGGSPLDVAKAVRLKAAYPELSLAQIPLSDLPERLVPFCALPTTAGTGSEVGRSSVITVEELGRKEVFGANPMLADMAILDPELTLELPPHLTAATGMDAMTHAVESFVCPVFHPMCDAIALEAVRLIRLYLPRAYASGSDIEARGLMQIAAAMGAVAFQKDLGAAHSLAHPLSAEFGVHHGLACALALPPVVRFNGETNGDRYARLADALGLVPAKDPAARVADAIEELNRSLGIGRRLRDLEVPKDGLPDLAARAMEDPCHRTNPRSCTKEDMLDLYRRIW
jgi:alcohol dehydrogenase class IV